MKRSLIKDEVDLKITGMHAGIKGSVSIFLSGDVSCLRGNVTGLSGNVNDCEITDSERKNGVKIEDLIDEKQS